jgi:flagellar basal-body rod protein FlgC
MGAFDMLRIAGSSLGAHQTWLDSIASNIANVNTIRSTSGPAYQATTPIVGNRSDGGVAVIGIAQSDPTGVLVYNPSHPLADAEGYVRAPSTDLGSQMSQLIMAQRGFQASVQVTKDAQDTYNAALQIGRG